MGCVVSEAASWVNGGEEGRLEYRERRTRETNTRPSFEHSGHDGCFHNGIQALKAVKETHDMIIATTPDFDTITPRIV